MQKRKPDVVVVSDVHLGTIGCHAKELCEYLDSIEPRTLILNGDIIDIWQFNKHYWPEAHSEVIKRLFSFLGKGVKIYYLTGNHDEALRKYSDFRLGNFTIADKLLLYLDGKMVWFFHGDVFDSTMKHAMWLAKLGSIGYDVLIILNRIINFILVKAGKEKMSLSKKIKDSVKKAVSFISDFENTAANIAIEKGYDYVVCGHIHQPQIKLLGNEKGQVTYLNSGDWVENLTALEYENGNWTIYHHKPGNSKVKNTTTTVKEFSVFTEDITTLKTSVILNSNPFL